jgi:putative spermidine/putrescine transport system substrate-binding protein
MSKLRRFDARVATGLIATAFALQGMPAAADDWRDLPLFQGLSGRIVHWNQSGGAWEDSWREAHIADFQQLTGARVDLTFYCCALDRLQVQVESGAVEWSVAAVGTEGQLLMGIEAGLFEPLDPAVVPFDRLPPGTYNEHAISNGVFASVLTWNTEIFGPGNEPEDATDIFDTDRFPGKRCFMQSVQLGGTLEVALLADGVPADELYPLDVERALAKLASIKDDIVWWRSGAESVQFILDGECDLGMAFNGRPYERVTKEGAPLAITWNNAVLNQSWLAIPKGAPEKELAQAYLAFVLYNDEGVVQHGVNIGYPSPVKGVYGKFSPEVQAWIAIGPNAEKGVWENAQFYKDNVAAVSRRFSEWLVSQ